MTIAHEPEEPSEQLDEEDQKNRLAAAEFDIMMVAKHVADGSHPNLMET